MHADAYLDATGWLCPLPVLEARKKLQQLHAGQVLTVDLTDPHGPLDFAVFCQRSGHELLSTLEPEHDSGIWQLRIRKCD